MKLKFLFLIALISNLISNTSCKKYLNERSDKTLVIPKSIKDIQRLLDHEGMVGGYPISGEIASDDIYYTYDNWLVVGSLDIRNTYIWEPNTSITGDYSFVYDKVARTNVALDAITNLNDKTATIDEINLARGSALFYRASGFYEIAQLISPQYSTQSAGTSYGIPLKRTSAIEDITVRSTVQETYDQILNDLKESASLLPSIILYKSRPSRAAAYALLSRVFLIIGNFDSAYKYSDLCLSEYNTLVDYNDIPYTSSFPFNQLGEEVIFHATSRSVSSFTRIRVDTALYNSYASDDLRKQAFYRISSGLPAYKCSYTGVNNPQFTGIATDEIYLIHAECNARLGKLEAALNDLNLLLEKRWLAGSFLRISASSADEALAIILNERRKELVFRGSLRWSDLRRLNLDDRYRKTLIRIMDSYVSELPPNDLRYTFLIPQSVIDISGIANNPR